jgi:hypothetical protein
MIERRRNDTHVLKIRRIKRETLAGLLIFCLTLTIFLCSPVHQVNDSQFSMLLSQSLLEHGKFPVGSLCAFAPNL